MSSEQWVELKANYLPHDPDDWGQRIVKEFWWRAIDVLDDGGISPRLPTLDGEARFHVRFYCDKGVHIGHLELFRLRIPYEDLALPAAIKASLLRSDVMPGSARWELWTPAGRSNRFLTFVEACSVLRIKRGLFHGANLANVPWDVAYAEMRKAGAPWADYLHPWFEHLNEVTQLGNAEHDDPLEYGHWFGHIMSDRFG